MSSLAQHSGFASGRMMLLFGIFGAHALLIYAISSGIITSTIVLPENLKVIFVPVDPVMEPVPPLPVPRDRLLPRDEWVVPEQVFDLPADSGDSTITRPPAQPDTGPVLRPHEARIVPLQYSSTRLADEFYPPMSQRLGEQGVAVVEACVGVNGRLDGTPSLRSSSGFARLDEAAVLYAQQALRFKPATSDGVPMRSCKGFRVNFRLKGG